MKILFACIPVPANKYMIDLVNGLSDFAEVTWDCDEFWSCKNEYDLVHVHWPEYLSYEVESYVHKTENMPAELWKRITTCLEYWHKNSTIVYTRHVRAPHTRDDNEFKKLYHTVFRYTKGIAHFAHFSTKQFNDFFPDLKNIYHTIIPQHNHASLPNSSTKKEAREALGIRHDAKVLICFGAIKENEKQWIDIAYKAIPGKNKVPP